MLISVVIPTHNRRVPLSHCLESLFRQSYPSADFEIVIALDGCVDDTRAFLRGLSFPCAHRVLEQENLGQASARNSGIRAAAGKYILLLDDDFVCDPALLAEHAKHHDRSGLVVYGPILRDLSRKSLPAIAVDREILPFYQNPGSAKQRAWLPPNSSIERQTLLACGGYDEQFFKAREDTDLGMRLADAGALFRYAPQAIVSQQYDKRASELVHDAEAFGKNEVKLIRKRPEYVFISNLSNLDQGRWWKRAGRQVLARAPISLEPALALVYRAAEVLSWNQVMRETGIRLLNLRRYIVWLRSASREAGGWKQIRSLIGNARSKSAKGSAAG